MVRRQRATELILVSIYNQNCSAVYVVHMENPSILEAEAGVSLHVSQPDLQRKKLFQNQSKTYNTKLNFMRWHMFLISIPREDSGRGIAVSSKPAQSTQ